uniref:Uncharacterized protein n=1 Tax=Lygus hesperus TaxID=30085 RepID=A0A0A9W1H1_LYGHE
MVFMADRAGVWLNEVVDESDAMLLDKREKKLRGVEEGGKGDAGDDQDEVDEDVEIIKKKKRPSAVSRPSQSGDGDYADKRAGGEKPAPPPSRPSKGKQVVEEAGKEEAGGKGQGSGNQSPKSKSGGKSPGEVKGESKGAAEGDASKKSVTNKPKSSKPTPREGSKQGGTGPKGSAGDSKAGSKSQQGAAKGQQGAAKGQQGGASGRTSGKESTSKPSSKPVEKKSMDKGPSSTAGTTKPSTSKDQSKVSHDGVKKDTSDTGKSPRGSQAALQRPRTASELKREKTAEILNTHLTQMVQETDKKPSPRQEALQDVISKRLEEKVGPRDSATIDAIREASALLATYIDNMTGKAEIEYGETTPAANYPPIAQRAKGPVFQSGSNHQTYSLGKSPTLKPKLKYINPEVSRRLEQ